MKPNEDQIQFISSSPKSDNPARYGDGVKSIEPPEAITLAHDQPFIIDTSLGADKKALAESRSSDKKA
jgi:hypothetical protein